MSELLPCPFCGSENVDMFRPTCNRKTPYNAAHRTYPWVQCNSCYASANGNDWDHSGRTAITAWNRRADARKAGMEEAAKIVESGSAHGSPDAGCEICAAALRAAGGSLSTQPGMVTVPVEPTEAMVMAYLNYVWDRCEDNALNVQCVWQAMIRAAAEPVSETGGKG